MLSVCFLARIIQGDVPYRSGTASEQAKEKAGPITRRSGCSLAIVLNRIYRTPPMKFMATKLAAKLSTKCQLL